MIAASVANINPIEIYYVKINCEQLPLMQTISKMNPTHRACAAATLITTALIVTKIPILITTKTAAPDNMKIIIKNIKHIKDGHEIITYRTNKVEAYCYYEDEKKPYYHAKDRNGSYFASLVINPNLPEQTRDEQIFNILEREYEGKSSSTDMMDPIFSVKY